MNIITRRTILFYIDKYPLAANSLKTWYSELSNAEYQSFNDLKNIYGNASIVANNRVIFNIKGNAFRLIVSINFKKQAVYVIWFGTHEEYDDIDAATIPFVGK
ncbi:type II toxin-antitoxin system HigB family toxin [Mucilaginibacter calamicampi]|uniref:Type II toxin-antitoxin system HigB family toxin n=1 Tax=Mucilaginibacter calamicampi TaxID=1302352 RepID=A0ABW2YR31_9SPHI